MSGTDPSDYAGEERLIVAFEKHDEFVSLLRSFLAVDLLVQPSPAELAAEERAFRKLGNILDEYQEGAYLLDPYLEELIGPPIEALRSYAAHVYKTGALGPIARVELLAKLIYWYTKTRGYKTIVRYFPHETADFGLVLGLLTKTLDTAIQWEVTYVLLLWLSLICMLPFDLSLFDEKGKEPVAVILERTAMKQLEKAGKERDAAAVLLSKLYIRKDAEHRLGPFFTWGSQTIQDSSNAYAALGFLEVIAESLKGGTHAALADHLQDIRQLLDVIKEDSNLMRNSLVRKSCSKISCRLAVMQLPSRNAPKPARIIRVGEEQNDINETTDDPEGDIPETMDEHVEELMIFLQDKDTVVRYSAAKGLARISERLPSEFADQVLETILSLYSQHEESVQAQEYVPEAEPVWHGATLACAEFARRGLIRGTRLSDVLEWATKALLFDVRKGAVSVGSNVRDAASYVIWSSARSQDAESIRPWSLTLAQRLVAVSVFDREITIRRAASAAFQEHVGRLSLFPHGIDVLRKTDFFAVSIRRHAFEVAGPEVAEHPEYRDCLLRHLETITLRHWDPQMRALAASAARRICDLDLLNLGPALVKRHEKLLTHPEATVVHGALLALSNLAEAMRGRPQPALKGARLGIFASISKVPPRKLESFRGELLLGAVCSVLAASASWEAMQVFQGGHPWQKILDLGMTSRDGSVQDEAANAWSNISGVMDCNVYLQRWVKQFPTATPTIQQGTAKVLGRLKYAAFPLDVTDAVSCLRSAIISGTPRYSPVIEVRQQCYVALHQMVCQDTVIIGADERLELFQSILQNMQDGLRDYTTDQRGDVGSWIRIECIKALGSIICGVFQQSAKRREPTLWLTQDQLVRLIGVMLKQGVERLDSVRDEVGIQLGAMLAAYASIASARSAWSIPGEQPLHELCNHEDNRTWKEGTWFFPKAVQLLILPDYRPFLLEGVAYSIGSKTESTLGPVGKALSEFAEALSVSSPDATLLSLYQLGKELMNQAKRNTANNSYFVPYMRTFLVLLETDVLQKLGKSEEGVALLADLVNVASRNIGRLKNIQRILICMKIITSAAAIIPVTTLTLGSIEVLLTHSVPVVRTDTAEALYLVGQTSEIFGDEEDRGEELLLETPWLNGQEEEYKQAAGEIVQIIREVVEGSDMTW